MQLMFSANISFPTASCSVLPEIWNISFHIASCSVLPEIWNISFHIASCTVLRRSRDASSLFHNRICFPQPNTAIILLLLLNSNTQRPRGLNHVDQCRSRDPNSPQLSILPLYIFRMNSYFLPKVDKMMAKIDKMLYRN